MRTVISGYAGLCAAGSAAAEPDEVVVQDEVQVVGLGGPGPLPLAAERRDLAVVGVALIDGGTADLDLAPEHIVLGEAFQPGFIILHHRHARASRVADAAADLAVLALVAVVAFAEQQPAALADDVLGILVVLSCYAAMAWLLFVTILLITLVIFRSARLWVFYAGGEA